MKYPFATVECVGFLPSKDNANLCALCGSRVGNHSLVPGAEVEELIKIRDSFIAQLPIVASIMLLSDDKASLEDVAVQSVDLVRLIEEELAK